MISDVDVVALLITTSGTLPQTNLSDVLQKGGESYIAFCHTNKKAKGKTSYLEPTEQLAGLSDVELVGQDDLGKTLG